MNELSAVVFFGSKSCGKHMALLQHNMGVTTPGRAFDHQGCSITECLIMLLKNGSSVADDLLEASLVEAEQLTRNASR
jgi:hypothetical protein